MIPFLQKRLFTTIGIDIGAVNSYISVLEPNGARIIENTEGSRVTPSYITVNNGKDKLYGSTSKAIAIQNKTNTFYGINMLLGRKFNDKHINSIISKLNYKVLPSKNNSLLLGNNKLSIENLSKEYISYLKKQAESLLGKPVTKAIIAVPSYMDSQGENVYNKIMKQCGIKVLKFVNESISSIHGYYPNKDKPNKLLIVNIGGMKCNVSYIEKENNEYKIKKEITDYDIGGNYFDKEIVDYLVYKFNKENNTDISKEPISLQRIVTAAEKAKIELSNSLQANINLPFITIDSKGIPKHLNITLSKSKYESLIDPLVSKLHEILLQFKANNITSPDSILLIGGMTRMPMIQKVIHQVYPNVKINKRINPEEAPCLGASVLSPYYASKKEIKSIQKLPLSLGIETLGGRFIKLIEKNELLPVEITKMATTTIDNQPKIEIKCYLGERAIAKDNIHLCTLGLGVPLSKREGIKIQLFANIDKEGNLTIGAIETMTKKSTVMNMNLLQYCDEEIVNESIKKGKEKEKEDKLKENKILKKVKIDYYIYQVEKNIREAFNHKKISKEKRDKIDKLISEITILLNEDMNEKVDMKYEELKRMINNIIALHKIPFNDYSNNLL